MIKYPWNIHETPAVWRVQPSRLIRPINAEAMFEEIDRMDRGLRGAKPVREAGGPGPVVFREPVV